MKFEQPKQVDPNSDPLFQQQRAQAEADKVKSLQDFASQETADITRRYGTRTASGSAGTLGAPGPVSPTSDAPAAGFMAYVLRNVFDKVGFR